MSWIQNTGFFPVQEDEENPDVRDGGDWEHAGSGPGGRRLQHSGLSIVVSRGGIHNYLSPDTELGFTIVVFGDRIHDSCRQYKNSQRFNTNRQRAAKKQNEKIIFLSKNRSSRMFEK
jgi:hypothetical protein